MSIIKDALKDAFSKKDKVVTKEEQVAKINQLKAELDSQMAELNKEDIKTIKVNNIPQSESIPAQDKDATSDKEVTLNDVLGDFETRLNRVEKIIEFMIYRR